jgi:hypothetical protein
MGNAKMITSVMMFPPALTYQNPGVGKQYALTVGSQNPEMGTQAKMSANRLATDQAHTTNVATFRTVLMVEVKMRKYCRRI